MRLQDPGSGPVSQTSGISEILNSELIQGPPFQGDPGEFLLDARESIPLLILLAKHGPITGFNTPEMSAQLAICRNPLLI